MLGAAHAFETFGGLAPCLLCLKQREVYWTAATVAVIAIVLSRSGEASPLRAAGVAATWAAYIFLAAALLFYALP
jgi:disulfide bond formation protein DsbB